MAVVKGKSKAVKTNTYEALRALFFSGKVKPSLNKIIAELENNPDNIQLVQLACQCLMRTKDYAQLAVFADKSIALDAENAQGYYFKGVALQYSKGKEQEALKNFNLALEIEPENTVYLKSKGTTHLLLYTDYHLPVKFAEKHRDKGEECFLKLVAISE